MFSRQFLPQSSTIPHKIENTARNYRDKKQHCKKMHDEAPFLVKIFKSFQMRASKIPLLLEREHPSASPVT